MFGVLGKHHLKPSIFSNLFDLGDIQAVTGIKCKLLITRGSPYRNIPTLFHMTSIGTHELGVLIPNLYVTLGRTVVGSNHPASY